MYSMAPLFYIHLIDLLNCPFLLSVMIIMIILHLQPELVQRVEKDLLNIMAGGTAENVDILLVDFVASAQASMT